MQNYRQQTALKATIDAVQHITISQQLYRLGQVSYLNVLDAERTLFDAQMNYLRDAGPIWAVMRHYSAGARGRLDHPEELLGRQARIPSNRNPAKS